MSTLANPTNKQRIVDLLDDLSPESLETVEGFVRFLREQARQAETTVTPATGEPAPFRYPTISLPLTTLGGLVGMMPPIGEDALAETEALYDIER